MDEIYREYLLEHYKSPKNKGKISDATIHKHDANPLCGDQVSMYMNLDDDGKITDIKFDGIGCVISMASASILTEYLEGKTLDDIRKMDRDEMLSLLDLKLTPTRVKCAMLALSTLKKGLLDYDSKSET